MGYLQTQLRAQASILAGDVHPDVEKPTGTIGEAAARVYGADKAPETAPDMAPASSAAARARALIAAHSKK